MKKSILTSLSALIALATVASAHADSLPTREEMWEMLKKQNQEIQALKARLGESEQKVNDVAATVESSSSSARGGFKWSDRISVSGTVEIDANSVNNDYAAADADSSDITVSTVELVVDAVINDWVTANVTLLYEEDDTALDVDSATITIANAEKTPLFLTAGSFGVPFGAYSTNLLSDPLTQTLGETAETAVQLGVATDNFTASVYLFNGSSDVGGKNNIDQFGFNVGYTGTAGALSVELGAGWINSLEDSDSTTVTTYTKHVSAGALNATLGFRGFNLTGEYITALEDFDTTQLTWTGGNKARPSAWNAELGYTFNVGSREATVAAAYQRSKEALGLGIPKKTILGGVSVGLFENTSLAFEWKQDTDYGTSDGARINGAAADTMGTGKNRETATLRLSVGF